jgi:hypothetical protein
MAVGRVIERQYSMIDYSKCSIPELRMHLENENKRLQANPVDASANARYKYIKSLLEQTNNWLGVKNKVL